MPENSCNSGAISVIYDLPQDPTDLLECVLVHNSIADEVKKNQGKSLALKKNFVA